MVCLGILAIQNIYYYSFWFINPDRGHSADDGYGEENTDWKRTYRGLLKGTPCVQEVYCHMSRQVELMSRSASIVEAFPPVPFEPPKNNDTTLAYAAFHRSLSFGCDLVGSFLSWLRGVKKVLSYERVQYRSQDENTLAVGVRYRGVSADAFLGQLFTMLVPHGGPEAFVGGRNGAGMVPHLDGTRCLVGALSYLGSLRVDVGGLRSDLYPDVLLDLADFPRVPPLSDLQVPVRDYVFAGDSLANRAFSGDCEGYLIRVVTQHMRFAGYQRDRIRTQYGRLLATLHLARKVAVASPQGFASLRHKWDIRRSGDRNCSVDILDYVI